MSSDDPEPPASFSSLRARFEQLSTTSPAPSQKPSALAGAAAKGAPLLRNGTVKTAQGAAAGTAERGAGEDGGCASQAVEGAADAAVAEKAPEPPAARAAPPARPPKPPAVARPATTVVGDAAPPAPPPQPVALPSQEPKVASTAPPAPAVEATAPVVPAEPARPPPAPLGTRPRNGTTTGSFRRPAPPPPVVRPKPASSLDTSLSNLALAQEAPALGTLQPQVPSPAVSPPVPSPALSVRSIASRFNEPSPLSRAPSTSPPVVASPSPAASSETDPFERGREDAEDSPVDSDEEEGEDEVDEKLSSSSAEESEGSIYSSSPEQVRTLPPRPAIPPRPPAIVELPPTPSVLSSDAPLAPPPLPTRASTASSSLSNPAATFVASPLAVSPTLARSLSGGASAIPSTSTSLPLPPPPPPRRDSTASPAVVPAAARAPALPTRQASVPPVALPPRPSPAPSPALVAAPPPTAAYIPPPPPTRTVTPADRLAPQRPNIVPSGEDGSSEDEEDETTKAQEFPDATFANRRPPVLRNRRPIIASNQFSAWAVRGSRVVTAHHRLHIWRPAASGAACESLAIANDQQKFLCVEFRAADADAPEDDGRYVWCGTKDGSVYEVDVEHLVITTVRTNVHAQPVAWIFRVGQAMVTVDEGGKCIFWGESAPADGRAAQLASTTGCKQQRAPDKQTFAAMVGDELWTSSGPVTKPGSTAVAMRSPQIRVFDPSGARGGAFALLARPLVTPESAGIVGAVTASAVVPAQEHLVYLAHDNGFVSVWDRATYVCVLVQRVSPYAVSALVGVRRFLWAGFRTGYIYVYDVSVEPWVVVKAWKAHKDPVIRLTVDPASLWKDETLQVASATNDTVCLWDGFLREDWIDAELHLRQPDYCTFRSVRALCISWNIDASRPGDLHGSVDNLDFLRAALTSAESPDIISIGFQEVIDLEDKKLTAKSMLMGKKKATDGKMSDSISSAYRQWHDKLVQAVRLNMPPETPYTVVHVADMIGLFSLVFVKNSEVPRLRDVAHITVKTGMGGRYGNKGGILSRFVIDDTSLCFINCHLAAGQSHRRQRDRDLVDILEDKAAFSELASSSPGAYAPGGSGTLPFDHELIILSGDLNYRIDARRDTVVSAVASGNSESLLAHDQLLKNLASNQTFRLRSFKEPAIRFPPTYKYDPGTDQYDSSAKRRIPAWCDRVLYRADRADKVTPLHYRRYEVNVSDHRPISAAFDLQVKHINSDKRAAVWSEVESAWFSVESGILEDARKWYAGK
ncbi:hypothetical protein JCM10449v2_001677 [Rhodotorula kratochvilovae]